MTAGAPTWSSDAVLRRLRGTGEGLIRSTGPGAAADRAMGRALTGFLDRIAGRGSGPAVDGIVALPFLVHGTHSGDPAPAEPAAVAHVLWWVAARYLDDLSDAGPRPPAAADTDSADQELLAVFGIACHLVDEVLDEGCRDDPARALRLRQELSRTWYRAIAGQLADLTATAATATAEEVMDGYLGKTGAPYAMAAAMGAVLAGCDEARVDAWRDLGARFGVLRQLVNDQRDIASGRYEDLRNGTATFMVVQYLKSLSEPERAVAEKLLVGCADSAAAREEFAARLTEPGRLRAFAAATGPLIDGLHASIDEAGGVAEYVAGLHALVDQTVNLYPDFLLGARD
ncbi:polyprenyl synthetase family protein [Kitasatospora purpeofusca]|uniref:polyprenyl synthetase family protein n=1 Tax=Kitasatospora purpeofusca TaxID=67352 RepID=UPI00386FA844|nr:polyprenyl synthetase family protein [Kitasatospora purpeofusca]